MSFPSNFPEPQDKSLRGFPWTEAVAPSRYAEASKWPKISIVTPSYNQGAFIERTIRSVLAQNYPNIEYLIIDGGSQDQTMQVLEKYKAWIDFVCSEPDEGQSDAINKGYARASGEVFNWLNSDDALAEDALYHIGKAFMDEQADIVSGQMLKFVEGFHELQIGPKKLPKTVSEALPWFGGQPSIYIRMQPYKKIGPVNKSLRYRMDMDWHWRYPLLFGVEGLRMLPELISYSNVHNECKTASQALGFQLEWNSILRDIAQRLGLQESLVFQAQAKLQFSPSYVSALQLDASKIDREGMLHWIDEQMRPQLQDASYIYRQAAYNLLYQGVAENSVPLAWEALCKAPWQLKNWRCYLYAKREAKRYKQVMKKS